jgi:hypothetical protein
MPTDTLARWALSLRLAFTGIKSMTKGTHVDPHAVATQIFKFWLAQGWARHHACGMVAQADAESSFNPKAIGDHHHAYGLYQLHMDRVLLIKNGCGVDISTLPDVDTQLKGIWWELQHSEKHALAMITAATNAYDAGAAACRYYERPGHPGEMDKRGRLAQTWMAYFDRNVPAETDARVDGHA